MLIKGDKVKIKNDDIFGVIVGQLGIEEVLIRFNRSGEFAWENRTNLEKMKKGGR